MNGFSIFSGSLDKTIKVHDDFPLSNRTINFNSSQVNRIQVSPDGRFIAAVGFENVCLYEFPTLHERVRARFDISNISDIKFSHDNSTVFLASENKKNTLQICDLESGLKIIKSYDSTFPIVRLAYHPLLDLCIGGNVAGHVHLFDSRNPRNHFLTSPYKGICSMEVDFSNNHLVVGNMEGSCFVYDLRMLSVEGKLAEFSIGQGCVLSCRVSSECIFTSSSTGTVSVYKSGIFEFCYSFTDRQEDYDISNWIFDCLPIYHKNGLRLITTNSSCLKLWDCSTGMLILSSKMHDMPITCLALLEY